MSKKRISELEEFVLSIAAEHQGCEDGWYACPKSTDYFGQYTEDEIPINDRPCYCPTKRARELMSMPDVVSADD